MSSDKVNHVDILRDVAQNILDLTEGLPDADSVAHYAKVLSVLALGEQHAVVSFTLNAKLSAYDSFTGNHGRSRSLQSSVKAIVKGDVASDEAVKFARTRQVCNHKVETSIEFDIPGDEEKCSHALMTVKGLKSGHVMVRFLEIMLIVERTCQCKRRPIVMFSTEQSSDTNPCFVVTCPCSSGWVEFLTCSLST